MRERVSAAQVPLSLGERAFYFVTRKNRLRRLELSLEQAQALESGALAVVERPEPGQIEHALVPADAAEALLRDFPKAVRFFNKQGEPVGFLSEDELKSRQHSESQEASAEEAAAEAPPKRSPARSLVLPLLCLCFQPKASRPVMALPSTRVCTSCVPS